MGKYIEEELNKLGKPVIDTIKEKLNEKLMTMLTKNMENLIIKMAQKTQSEEVGEKATE